MDEKTRAAFEARLGELDHLHDKPIREHSRESLQVLYINLLDMYARERGARLARKRRTFQGV